VQAASQPEPQQLLADLQCRVFEEACASRGEALLAVTCARRAQQGTPRCLER
jgi:hypothetical protein